MLVHDFDVLVLAFNREIGRRDAVGLVVQPQIRTQAGMEEFHGHFRAVNMGGLGNPVQAGQHGILTDIDLGIIFPGKTAVHRRCADGDKGAAAFRLPLHEIHVILGDFAVFGHHIADHGGPFDTVFQSVGTHL